MPGEATAGRSGQIADRRESACDAVDGSHPPCLVGMEACATSHHRAREIEALGHQVRLMPLRCVKPYVKRNQNDRADAEAICEAVVRAIQAAPLLAGRPAQLEDHGKGRLAAEAALGLGAPEPHGRKGALYGVRRSDVRPVLGRKIVEGQQNVPVLGQAGGRLVALGAIGLAEGVAGLLRHRLGIRPSRCPVGFAWRVAGRPWGAC